VTPRLRELGPRRLVACHVAEADPQSPTPVPTDDRMVSAPHVPE
jgi:hypothetical protein